MQQKLLPLLVRLNWSYALTRWFHCHVHTATNTHMACVIWAGCQNVYSIVVHSRKKKRHQITFHRKDGMYILGYLCSILYNDEYATMWIHFQNNIDGRKQPTEKHMQYDSNYMKSPKQKVFFCCFFFFNAIRISKWITYTKFNIDSLWSREKGWDLRGEIGLWESNDVPFTHLGSENLVLCFSKNWDVQFRPRWWELSKTWLAV